MNISNVDSLKQILPDFGPYIDQQFKDQSEVGVSRGIKRFVNSLAPKKLFQAANQIDEWMRNNQDKNKVEIVEAVREGIRVKISLMGIFILSKHPSLRKMNRYAIKDVIGSGNKGNYKQVASQIRLYPENIEKVGRILLKLKKDHLNVAQDFCFTLTQELVKNSDLHDRCINLVLQFNDNDTSKRLYEYFSSVTLVTKEAHPFKTHLEKKYPELAKKEEVKPKKNDPLPTILLTTLVLSIIGFAISYIFGALIALTGAAVAAFYYRPDF